MAQWQRAGPITQRSVDQNYLLLNLLTYIYRSFCMPICTAVEVFYLEKSDWLGLYKQLDISDSSGVVFGCGWCRCVARVCIWVFVCMRGCVYNFYKFFSLYGTKISIFEKSVSDNFFHSQNMFHNISRWLKLKNRQKFFPPHFSKVFVHPHMRDKKFLFKNCVLAKKRGDILFRFSKFSNVPPRCCRAEKIRLPKMSVPPPPRWGSSHFFILLNTPRT